MEMALPFHYPIMRRPRTEYFLDLISTAQGFAFVYMEDERDAEDAIRALDRFEFGRKGRRLRVEWTKQERGSSRRVETSRKPASNSRPSKTLFVINFDPYHTRTRDLERHFDPYGKILNIRIRKNFAFIQYELQEDATKALEATNLSKLMDRVISVEYAMKDDDDKKPSYGTDRERDRSPRRGYGGNGRSPSPHARERGSPDYGHARGRRSPSPYGRERESPDYGHRPRVHSISPTGKGRNSDYGRERSPIPRKERKPHRSRDLSASPQRERNGNSRGLSPPRKASPGYPIPDEEKDVLSPREYRRSRIPAEEKDALSPGEYRRSRIPAKEKDALSPGEYRRTRIPVEEKDVPSPGEYRRSRIPAEEKDALSPGEYRRGRIPAKEKDAPSPGEYRRSRIPDEENDALSPGEYRRSRSPDDRYFGEESPAPKRSMSRSPPARERSRS